jgi:hypothetical protein
MTNIPAIGKDEAITQRQEITSSKLPITRDVKRELDIELEERIPQIRPRQSFGYQLLIRFAMEGQPADFASMAIKNAMEKKKTLDIMPNIPVANMQKPMEIRNTLRPPNRSAKIPVVSFPTSVPAVPQPRIDPHIVLFSPNSGSSSIAGLDMTTVVLQILSTA